jgi:hypothetical protein
MLTVSLFAAVSLIAGGDPDGVVATAPKTTVELYATERPEAASPAAAALAAAPHGLTTDQQISRWIDDRSPGTLPFAEGAGSGPVDDRQMHSQFSVGVGTGGYRDYGVAVSLPLGETGRLNLSYRQVENGYPVFGYGNGYGYPAYGYGYGHYTDYGYAPRMAPRAGGGADEKAGSAGLIELPLEEMPARASRLRALPRD